MGTTPVRVYTIGHKIVRKPSLPPHLKVATARIVDYIGWLRLRKPGATVTYRYLYLETDRSLACKWLRVS